jgi:hypothetical protein
MASSFSPLGACAPPIPQFLGSQVIVRTLLEQGVEVVFGYLGAAVMPSLTNFGTWSSRQLVPTGIIVTCFRRIR